MPVRALWWQRDHLELIDQRELPRRTRVLKLRRLRDVADAIRSMAVRGAPAIGAAAAFGMAIAAREGTVTPGRAAARLAATRPTGNDLFVGIEAVRSAWERGDDPLERARAYTASIVEECRSIGIAGAPLLRSRPRVLTHCNAGALATVEWGTALAPIRIAARRQRRLFVWVDETRPRLQGSRLTAWELAQERIPHAVIADNAAGLFLRRGEVDVVLLGADRIAANGDVANKIGTYEKAVVARENGVPVYVAAPWSTFDPGTATGENIPIEERGADELRAIAGGAFAPAESPLRNPAFDVTPARYITGFVTPDGVLRPGAVGRAARRHSRPAVRAPPRRNGN